MLLSNNAFASSETTGTQIQNNDDTNTQIVQEIEDNENNEDDTNDDENIDDLLDTVDIDTDDNSVEEQRR